MHKVLNSAIDDLINIILENSKKRQDVTIEEIVFLKDAVNKFPKLDKTKQRSFMRNFIASRLPPPLIMTSFPRFKHRLELILTELHEENNLQLKYNIIKSLKTLFPGTKIIMNSQKRSLKVDFLLPEKKLGIITRKKISLLNSDLAVVVLGADRSINSHLKLKRIIIQQLASSGKLSYL